MKKLILILLVVLAGCSLIRRDPLCPPPSSRAGYLGFWRLHAPFADQARAEKWSLAETCRAQSEYDDSHGTAPFYLADSDSPTGWCYCPVR